MEELTIDELITLLGDNALQRRANLTLVSIHFLNLMGVEKPITQEELRAMIDFLDPDPYGSPGDDSVSVKYIAGMCKGCNGLGRRLNEVGMCQVCGGTGNDVSETGYTSPLARDLAGSTPLDPVQPVADPGRTRGEH